MNTKSLHLLVLFSCFLFTGCHKTVIDEPADCNCDGKPVEVINDAAVQISGSPGRYLFLKETVGQGVSRMLFLCDTSMIAGLSTSKDGDYNYVIDGNLRPPCSAKGVVYVWYVELTSIRKK